MQNFEAEERLPQGIHNEGLVRDLWRQGVTPAWRQEAECIQATAQGRD